MVQTRPRSGELVNSVCSVPNGDDQVKNRMDHGTLRTRPSRVSGFLALRRSPVCVLSIMVAGRSRAGQGRKDRAKIALMRYYGRYPNAAGMERALACHLAYPAETQALRRNGVGALDT